MLVILRLGPRAVEEPRGELSEDWVDESLPSLLIFKRDGSYTIKK